jgi:RimJ/RimL family protein N-acetyltransferase
MIMLKGESIYLRMLEQDDWQFTYKWHNDPDLQRFTCGPMRIVSKEIEQAWVQSVVSDNRKDIYLAICDVATGKMIGYRSVNDINHLYRSCSLGGIVIGDKDYQDGIASIESSILLLDYVFNQLNMHRVTGACLSVHPVSRAKMLAFGFEQEGCQRDAVLKNGRYYDVLTFALLRSTYQKLLEDETYTLKSMAKRYIKIQRELREPLK